jgi:hypothetical protein
MPTALGCRSSARGWAGLSATPRKRVGSSRWPGTRIYLSHDDALEFFARAVEADNVPFAALFVVSKNGGRALFDVEPTRTLLGFEPRDTWPEGSSWSSELHFPSPRYAASLIPG